jgi:hypothetical protein
MHEPPEQRESRGLKRLVSSFLIALIAGTSASSTRALQGTRPPEPRARGASTLPLELDHVILHVVPGAPERAALERAGFTIAPGVNQHEGQGSASVTVELSNGFLELTWRDTSVSVDPALERIARRFLRQSEWRTSGWSPFGIGLRRIRGAPDSLPFPTRAVRAPWMEPGASIEIVSAADDTLGPRLWVVPRSMAANGIPATDSERRRLAKRETFVHSNRARAITAVRMTVPDGALTTAAERVASHSPVAFERGDGWRLDITFDRGRRGVTRDLRPELPVVCHF